MDIGLNWHHITWTYCFGDSLWHGFGVNVLRPAGQSHVDLAWPVRLVDIATRNCRVEVLPDQRASEIPSVVAFRLIPERVAQVVTIQGVLGVMDSYLLVNTTAWGGWPAKGA